MHVDVKLFATFEKGRFERATLECAPGTALAEGGPATAEGAPLRWRARREPAGRVGVSLAGVARAGLALGLLPGRYRRNRETVSTADQLRLFRSRAAVIGCGGLGGY